MASDYDVTMSFSEMPTEFEHHHHDAPTITPLARVDYGFDNTPMRLKESYGRSTVTKESWPAPEPRGDTWPHKGARFDTSQYRPSTTTGSWASRSKGDASQGNDGDGKDGDAWEERVGPAFTKAKVRGPLELAEVYEAHALMRALHIPPWDFGLWGIKGRDLLDILRRCVNIGIDGKKLKALLRVLASPIQEGGGLASGGILRVLAAIDALEVLRGDALSLVQCLDGAGPHPLEWDDILGHLVASGARGVEVEQAVGAACEAGIPGPSIAHTFKLLVDGGVKGSEIRALLRGVAHLKPECDRDRWVEVLLASQLPPALIEEVGELMATANLAGTPAAKLLAGCWKEGGEKAEGAAPEIASVFRALHLSGDGGLPEATALLAKHGMTNLGLEMLLESRAAALADAGIEGGEERGKALEQLNAAGLLTANLLKTLRAMSAAGIKGEALAGCVAALQDVPLPGRQWSRVVTDLAKLSANPEAVLKALKAAEVSPDGAVTFVDACVGAAVEGGDLEGIIAALSGPGALAGQGLVDAVEMLCERGVGGAATRHVAELLTGGEEAGGAGQSGPPLAGTLELCRRARLSGEVLHRALAGMVACGIRGPALPDVLAMLADGGLSASSFARAAQTVCSGEVAGEEDGGLPILALVVHRGGLRAEDEAVSLDRLSAAGFDRNSQLVQLIRHRLSLFAGLNLVEPADEDATLTCLGAIGAYGEDAHASLASLSRAGCLGPQVPDALGKMHGLGVKQADGVVAVCSAFCEEAPHAGGEEFVELLGKLASDESCRGREAVLRAMQVADISSKHAFSTTRRYHFGCGDDGDGGVKPLLPLDDARAVVVAVRAEGDAILGFFCDAEGAGEACYEVVISGWGNSRSELRRKRVQRPALAGADTRGFLSASETRFFWAEARGGRVRVGRGPRLGQDVFLSYDDPAPLEVTHFGVTTGFAVAAEWEVTVVDKVPMALLRRNLLVGVGTVAPGQEDSGPDPGAADAPQQMHRGALSFASAADLRARFGVLRGPFALKFEGHILVATPGQHTFRLDCADSAILVVGEGQEFQPLEVPASKDRAYFGPSDVTYELPEGWHPVTLDFRPTDSAGYLLATVEGPALPETNLATQCWAESPGRLLSAPNLRPGHSAVVVDHWTAHTLPDFGALKQPTKASLYTGPISFVDRDEFARTFDVGVELHAVQLEGCAIIDKSGEYTFWSTSDDGSKLYVDGELVVDNSGLHSARTRKGAIKLSKGRHSIRACFFSHRGASVFHVYAEGPGKIERQLVTLPTWRPSKTPKGRPLGPVAIVDRYTPQSMPDFSTVRLWAPIRSHPYEGPIEFRTIREMKRTLGVPLEMFAVQFTVELEVEEGHEGLYKFSVTSDDGSQVLVDDKLVVENGGLHAARMRGGQIKLAAGMHKVRVPFFDHRGSACLKAHVQGPGFRRQPLIVPAFSAAAASEAGFPAVLSFPNYLPPHLPDFDNSALLSAKEFDFEGPIYFSRREEMHAIFQCGVEHFALQFITVIEIEAAGQFTFWVSSDDGSELYVDNQLVVQNRGLHGMKTVSGTIDLEPGTYTLRVPFFNHRGKAVLRAYAQGPGLRKQPVTVPFWSAAQAAPYSAVLYQVRYRPPSMPNFASPHLNGAHPHPYEGPIDFSTRDVFHKTFGCGVEYFAFQFESIVEVSEERAGEYYFWLNSDDGSQLFVDDDMVVNNGGLHAPRVRDGGVRLSAGRHVVRVAMFQHTGQAALQVWARAPGAKQELLTVPAWDPPAARESWPAVCVLSNYRSVDIPDFDAPSMIAATEPEYEGPIDFGHRDLFDRTFSSGPEFFAMQFVSTIEVEEGQEGSYTFTVVSDDGSELWVGGKRVVNNGGLHPARSREGKVDLAPGKHVVRVPFFQHAGHAVLHVHVQPQGKRRVLLAVPAWSPSASDAWPAILVQPDYRAAAYPDFDHPSLAGAAQHGYEGPIDFADRDALHGTFECGHEFFAFQFVTTIEVPAAGLYTFWLSSDDGGWLFVDEKRVVDNGGLHPPRTRTGTAALTPGKHLVRIPFFQHGGLANIQVWVRAPGARRALLTVPSWAPPPAGEGWPAVLLQREYRGAIDPDMDSPALADAEAMAYEGPVDFANRDVFKSLLGFPIEFFACQFTARVTIPEERGGVYKFYVTSDDGANLFVDDRLVVSNGGLHGPRARSGRATLAPGDHTVRVPMFQHGGLAVLRVWVVPPGASQKEVLTVPSWEPGPLPDT